MMRTSRALALMAGMFLVCTISAQEGAETTPYYPIKKDNTWTFKVQNNTIQLKVTSIDAEGAKLETLVNNKSVANEVISVKKDGIYRVAINGQKPKTPVKFFSLPPKKDDSWEVDTEIQGQKIKGKFIVKEDQVKVPAGEYKVFVVDGENFEVAGMSTKIKYWFAEKVGIVKLTFTLGGLDATLELEKFEEAK
jgi:hypothetical protein